AHIDAAVALELFHTATLLHDDVIDQARLRRGIPTHNARYGNEAAVIFGDYLLSCALVSASSDELAACRGTLISSARAICEGEMEQVFRRYDLTLSENDYLRIVDRKTAILFASACEVGASLSGADERSQKALYDFGRMIGVAFQIVDDLIDAFGSEKTAGKSLRSDIGKGELTLPFIRLLSVAAEREELAGLITPDAGPGGDSWLAALLERYDSLEYSLGVARRHVAGAKAALEHLPASPARYALFALANTIIDPNRFAAARAGASAASPGAR
ncbi:MAG TPA: polyprenyl synthetase family protein, partial [bacterium]|nr:polyprenyl synthetase family protein [bacterium]